MHAADDDGILAVARDLLGRHDLRARQEATFGHDDGDHATALGIDHEIADRFKLDAVLERQNVLADD